ncbi:MAG TPA: hypothetical protein PKL97_07620 [Candidatus Omnitrophota bacterium]|nr:hypothetical protein [Candidatus Omnitrophota bacterium]
MLTPVPSSVLNAGLHGAQLLSAWLLLQGNILQVGTGEGKTFGSGPALFVQALTGGRVFQIVTTDYFVQKDAKEVQPQFEILGMGLDKFDRNDDDETKKRKLGNSGNPMGVTYIAVDGLAFEYIQDRVKPEGQRVFPQSVYDAIYRKDRSGIFQYANIDEVDAVLLDQAMNDYIIASPSRGGSEQETYQFVVADQIARGWIGNAGGFEEQRGVLMSSWEEYREARRRGERLEEGRTIDANYFTVNFADSSLNLTNAGRQQLMNLYESMRREGAVSLPDSAAEFVRIVENALHEHLLSIEGVDYVVMRDGTILLTDKNTGEQTRRTKSGGLHTALQAKHRDRPNVRIVTGDSKTVSKISTKQLFEDLFAQFSGFSGSVSTSEESAEEFVRVYGRENGGLYDGKRVARIPSTAIKVRQDIGEDRICSSFEDAYDYLKGEVLAAASTRHGAPCLFVFRDKALVDALEKRLLEDEAFLKELYAAEYAAMDPKLTDREKIARLRKMLKLKLHILDGTESLTEKNRILGISGNSGHVTLATAIASRGVDFKVAKIDEIEGILKQIAARESLAPAQKEAINKFLAKLTELKNAVRDIENRDASGNARLRLIRDFEESAELAALESAMDELGLSASFEYAQKQIFSSLYGYQIRSQVAYSERVDAQIKGRGSRQEDFSSFQRFMIATDSDVSSDEREIMKNGLWDRRALWRQTLLGRLGTQIHDPGKGDWEAYQALVEQRQSLTGSAGTRLEFGRQMQIAVPGSKDKLVVTLQEEKDSDGNRTEIRVIEGAKWQGKEIASLASGATLADGMTVTIGKESFVLKVSGNTLFVEAAEKPILEWTAYANKVRGGPSWAVDIAQPGSKPISIGFEYAVSLDEKNKGAVSWKVSSLPRGVKTDLKVGQSLGFGSVITIDGQKYHVTIYGDRITLTRADLHEVDAKIRGMIRRAQKGLDKQAQQQRGHGNKFSNIDNELAKEFAEVQALMTGEHAEYFGRAIALSLVDRAEWLYENTLRLKLPGGRKIGGRWAREYTVTIEKNRDTGEWEYDDGSGKKQILRHDASIRVNGKEYFVHIVAQGEEEEGRPVGTIYLKIAKDSKLDSADAPGTTLEEGRDIQILRDALSALPVKLRDEKKLARDNAGAVLTQLRNVIHGSAEPVFTAQEIQALLGTFFSDQLRENEKLRGRHYLRPNARRLFGRVVSDITFFDGGKIREAFEEHGWMRGIGQTLIELMLHPLGGVFKTAFWATAWVSDSTGLTGLIRRGVKSAQTLWAWAQKPFVKKPSEESRLSQTLEEGAYSDELAASALKQAEAAIGGATTLDELKKLVGRKGDLRQENIDRIKTLEEQIRLADSNLDQMEEGDSKEAFRKKLDYLRKQLATHQAEYIRLQLRLQQKMDAARRAENAAKRGGKVQGVDLRGILERQARKGKINAVWAGFGLRVLGAKLQVGKSYEVESDRRFEERMHPAGRADEIADVVTREALRRRETIRIAAKPKQSDAELSRHLTEQGEKVREALVDGSTGQTPEASARGRIMTALSSIPDWTSMAWARIRFRMKKTVSADKMTRIDGAKAEVAPASRSEAAQASQAERRYEMQLTEEQYPDYSQPKWAVDVDRPDLGMREYQEAYDAEPVAAPQVDVMGEQVTKGHRGVQGQQAEAVTRIDLTIFKPISAAEAAWQAMQRQAMLMPEPEAGAVVPEIELRLSLARTGSTQLVSELGMNLSAEAYAGLREDRSALDNLLESANESVQHRVIGGRHIVAGMVREGNKNVLRVFDLGTSLNPDWLEAFNRVSGSPEHRQHLRLTENGAIYLGGTVKTPAKLERGALVLYSDLGEDVNVGRNSVIYRSHVREGKIGENVAVRESSVLGTATLADGSRLNASSCVDVTLGENSVAAHCVPQSADGRLTVDAGKYKGTRISADGKIEEFESSVDDLISGAMTEQYYVFGKTFARKALDWLARLVRWENAHQVALQRRQKESEALGTLLMHQSRKVPPEGQSAEDKEAEWRKISAAAKEIANAETKTFVTRIVYPGLRIAAVIAVVGLLFWAFHGLAAIAAIAKLIAAHPSIVSVVFGVPFSLIMYLVPKLRDNPKWQKYVKKAADKWEDVKFFWRKNTFNLKSKESIVSGLYQSAQSTRNTVWQGALLDALLDAPAMGKGIIRMTPELSRAAFFAYRADEIKRAEERKKQLLAQSHIDEDRFRTLRAQYRDMTDSLEREETALAAFDAEMRKLGRNYEYVSPLTGTTRKKLNVQEFMATRDADLALLQSLNEWLAERDSTRKQALRKTLDARIAARPKGEQEAIRDLMSLPTETARGKVTAAFVKAKESVERHPDISSARAKLQAELQRELEPSDVRRTIAERKKHLAQDSLSPIFALEDRISAFRKEIDGELAEDARYADEIRIHKALLEQYRTVLEDEYQKKDLSDSETEDFLRSVPMASLLTPADMEKAVRQALGADLENQQGVVNRSSEFLSLLKKLSDARTNGDSEEKIKEIKEEISSFLAGVSDPGESKQLSRWASDLFGDSPEETLKRIQSAAETDSLRLSFYEIALKIAEAKSKGNEEEALRLQEQLGEIVPQAMRAGMRLVREFQETLLELEQMEAGDAAQFAEQQKRKIQDVRVASQVIEKIKAWLGESDPAKAAQRKKELDELLLTFSGTDVIAARETSDRYLGIGDPSRRQARLDRLDAAIREREAQLKKEFGDRKAPSDRQIADGMRTAFLLSDASFRLSDYERFVALTRGINADAVRELEFLRLAKQWLELNRSGQDIADAEAELNAFLGSVEPEEKTSFEARFEEWKKAVHGIAPRKKGESKRKFKVRQEKAEAEFTRIASEIDAKVRGIGDPRILELRVSDLMKAVVAREKIAEQIGAGVGFGQVMRDLILPYGINGDVLRVLVRSLGPDWGEADLDHIFYANVLLTALNQSDEIPAELIFKAFANRDADAIRQIASLAGIPSTTPMTLETLLEGLGDLALKSGGLDAPARDAITIGDALFKADHETDLDTKMQHYQTVQKMLGDGGRYYEAKRVYEHQAGRVNFELGMIYFEQKKILLARDTFTNAKKADYRLKKRAMEMLERVNSRSEGRVRLQDELRAFLQSDAGRKFRTHGTDMQEKDYFLSLSELVGNAEFMAMVEEHPIFSEEAKQVLRLYHEAWQQLTNQVNQDAMALYAETDEIFSADLEKIRAGLASADATVRERALAAWEALRLAANSTEEDPKKRLFAGDFSPKIALTEINELIDAIKQRDQNVRDREDLSRRIEETKQLGLKPAAEDTSRLESLERVIQLSEMRGTLDESRSGFAYRLSLLDPSDPADRELIKKMALAIQKAISAGDLPTALASITPEMLDGVASGDAGQTAAFLENLRGYAAVGDKKSARRWEGRAETLFEVFDSYGIKSRFTLALLANKKPDEGRETSEIGSGKGRLREIRLYTCYLERLAEYVRFDEAFVRESIVSDLYEEVIGHSTPGFSLVEFSAADALDKRAKEQNDPQAIAARDIALHYGKGILLDYIAWVDDEHAFDALPEEKKASLLKTFGAIDKTIRDYGGADTKQARVQTAKDAITLVRRERLLKQLGYDTPDIEGIRRHLKEQRGDDWIDWKESAAHLLRGGTGGKLLVKNIAAIMAFALVVRPGYSDYDPDSIRRMISEFIDSEYYQWWFLDRPAETLHTPESIAAEQLSRHANSIREREIALLNAQVRDRIGGLTPDQLKALAEDYKAKRGPDFFGYEQGSPETMRYEGFNVAILKIIEDDTITDKRAAIEALLSETAEKAQFIEANRAQYDQARKEVEDWSREQNLPMIREVDRMDAAIAKVRGQQGLPVPQNWQDLIRARHQEGGKTLRDLVVEEVVQIAKGFNAKRDAFQAAESDIERRIQEDLKRPGKSIATPIPLTDVEQAAQKSQTPFAKTTPEEAVEGGFALDSVDVADPEEFFAGHEPQTFVYRDGSKIVAFRARPDQLAGLYHSRRIREAVGSGHFEAAVRIYEQMSAAERGFILSGGFASLVANAYLGYAREVSEDAARKDEAEEMYARARLLNRGLPDTLEEYVKEQEDLDAIGPFVDEMIMIDRGTPQARQVATAMILAEKAVGYAIGSVGGGYVNREYFDRYLAISKGEITDQEIAEIFGTDPSDEAKINALRHDAKMGALLICRLLDIQELSAARQSKIIKIKSPAQMLAEDIPNMIHEVAHSYFYNQLNEAQQETVLGTVRGLPTYQRFAQLLIEDHHYDKFKALFPDLYPESARELSNDERRFLERDLASEMISYALQGEGPLHDLLFADPATKAALQKIFDEDGFNHIVDYIRRENGNVGVSLDDALKQVGAPGFRPELEEVRIAMDRRTDAENARQAGNLEAAETIYSEIVEVIDRALESQPDLKKGLNAEDLADLYTDYAKLLLELGRKAAAEGESAQSLGQAQDAVASFRKADQLYQKAHAAMVRASELNPDAIPQQQALVKEALDGIIDVRSKIIKVDMDELRASEPASDEAKAERERLAKELIETSVHRTDILILRGNLALKEKDFAGAERLFHAAFVALSALEIQDLIREKDMSAAFATEPGTLADCYCGWAKSLEGQGRLGEAAAMFEEAIKMGESALKPEDSKFDPGRLIQWCQAYVNILSDMAQKQEAQGDFEGAVICYRKILSTHARVAKIKPDLAERITEISAVPSTKLAILLSSMRKYEESEKYFAVWRATFNREPSEDSSLKALQENYGQIGFLAHILSLYKLGKIGEAQAIYEEVRQRRQELPEDWTEVFPGYAQFKINSGIRRLAKAEQLQESGKVSDAFLLVLKAIADLREASEIDPKFLDEEMKEILSESLAEAIALQTNLAAESGVTASPIEIKYPEEFARYKAAMTQVTAQALGAEGVEMSLEQRIDRLAEGLAARANVALTPEIRAEIGANIHSIRDAIQSGRHETVYYPACGRDVGRVMLAYDPTHLILGDSDEIALDDFLSSDLGITPSDYLEDTTQTERPKGYEDQYGRKTYTVRTIRFMFDGKERTITFVRGDLRKIDMSPYHHNAVDVAHIYLPTAAVYGQVPMLYDIVREGGFCVENELAFAGNSHSSLPAAFFELTGLREVRISGREDRTAQSGTTGEGLGAFRYAVYQKTRDLTPEQWRAATEILSTAGSFINKSGLKATPRNGISYLTLGEESVSDFAENLREIAGQLRQFGVSQEQIEEAIRGLAGNFVEALAWFREFKSGEGALFKDAYKRKLNELRSQNVENITHETICLAIGFRKKDGQWISSEFPHVAATIDSPRRWKAFLGFIGSSFDLDAAIESLSEALNAAAELAIQQPISAQALGVEVPLPGAGTTARFNRDEALSRLTEGDNAVTYEGTVLPDMWRALVNSVTRVSHSDFTVALNETATALNASLTGAPYAVLWDSKPHSSKRWVYEQIADGLAYPPAQKTYFSPAAEDRLQTARTLIAQGIDTFVIADDACYSGEQISKTIRKILAVYQNLRETDPSFDQSRTPHFVLAVPYMSSKADAMWKDFAAQLAQNNAGRLTVCSTQTMPTIEELLRLNDPANPYAKWLERHNGRLFMDDEEPLYTGATLTYFDHRVADNWSFAGELRPFFAEYEKPYAERGTAYYQWEEKEFSGFWQPMLKPVTAQALGAEKNLLDTGTKISMAGLAITAGVLAILAASPASAQSIMGGTHAVSVVGVTVLSLAKIFFAATGILQAIMEWMKPQASPLRKAIGVASGIAVAVFAAPLNFSTALVYGSSGIVSIIESLEKSKGLGVSLISLTAGIASFTLYLMNIAPAANLMLLAVSAGIGLIPFDSIKALLRTGEKTEAVSPAAEKPEIAQALGAEGFLLREFFGNLLANMPEDEKEKLSAMLAKAGLEAQAILDGKLLTNPALAQIFGGFDLTDTETLKGLVSGIEISDGLPAGAKAYITPENKIVFSRAFINELTPEDTKNLAQVLLHEIGHAWLHPMMKGLWDDNPVFGLYAEELLAHMLSDARPDFEAVERHVAERYAQALEHIGAVKTETPFMVVLYGTGAQAFEETVRSVVGAQDLVVARDVRKLAREIDPKKIGDKTVIIIATSAEKEQVKAQLPVNDYRIGLISAEEPKGLQDALRLSIAAGTRPRLAEYLGIADKDKPIDVVTLFDRIAAIVAQQAAEERVKKAA